MGATIKQTHYEPLPVGEYPAKIGAVEVSDGQYGSQVKLRFDVTAAGFEDRSVTGWASATFSPKSKLYQWVRAAFGRDIPSGYDLNTDHLLDRPVTLVLVTKAGDDGGEYNRIHDVKPAKRNGNGSQPVKLTPPNVSAVPAPAMATLSAEERAILKPRPPVVATQPSNPDEWPGWDDVPGEPGDGGSGSVVPF
jgi:hypothetical protein